MKRVLLAALLPALLFSAGEACAEIYKWTDADGRVHFGDKPHDQKVKAQEVEVKDYAPGTDDETRAINERRERLMNADKSAKKQTTTSAAFEAALKAKQQEDRCRAGRERLKNVSGRVTFLDEDGKVVPTTERQRQEKQREVEAWLRENCS